MLFWEKKDAIYQWENQDITGTVAQIILLTGVDSASMHRHRREFDYTTLL